MPQLQTLDLGDEVSPLERTLEGFNKRREDLKEVDALKQIYQRYQESGNNLAQALPDIIGNPDLGPTARVNGVKNLLAVQKYNDEQAEKVKKQLKETEDNSFKLAKEKRLIESQEATRKHQESVEKRLTEQNLSNSYNHEISQINTEMKDAFSEEKRAPLRARLEELKSMKSRDIKRFNRGERDFVPELYADAEVAQVQQPTPPQSMPAVENDPIVKAVTALTERFPPAQFQGKSKWDKEGNEYKSDGIKWLPV